MPAVLVLAGQPRHASEPRSGAKVSTPQGVHVCGPATMLMLPAAQAASVGRQGMHVLHCTQSTFVPLYTVNRDSELHNMHLVHVAKHSFA